LPESKSVKDEIRKTVNLKCSEPKKTTGLSLEEALKYAKEGFELTQEANPYRLREGGLLFLRDDGSPDKTILWVSDIEKLLANTWKLKPKPISFQEAVWAVMDGKRVRCIDGDGTVYSFDRDRDARLPRCDGRKLPV